MINKFKAGALQTKFKKNNKIYADIKCVMSGGDKNAVCNYNMKEMWRIDEEHYIRWQNRRDSAARFGCLSHDASCRGE